MSGFLLVLSFFTRLPLGKYVEYTEKRYLEGLATFPLTGIVIGAFLTLPYLMIDGDSAIAGLLVVIIYLFITGGIHLDGLADSCDGLFSNRPKERVLEIMKDSHIGTFGVIALIIYFLCFYVGITRVDWLWLLLMPLVGKTMGFFAAGLSTYAREDQGMGFLFIDRIQKKHSIIYLTLLLLAIGGLLNIDGLIALCGAFVATMTIMNLTKKVIGGQTGDTIGMTIEVSQMVFLLCGALLGR
jgi:adenosylcobinamide-GDP ribazoletransferase